MRRRTFLLGSSAVAALSLSGLPVWGHTTAETKVRVVIVGAGAAGLTLAARLHRQLPRATIRLIDAKKDHHFQPGFTLVAAGLWSPASVTEQNADYVPRGVEWISEWVSEFDPVGSRVITQSGRSVPYDFLFVATGLSLEYAAIEGMDPRLIGREGIGSVYAGPDAAAATAIAIDRFIEKGGTGLFTRPATEMKCAGAPLKMTFITEDKANRAKRRSTLNLVYNAHNQTVFSVPPVHDKVAGLFAERGIGINYEHALTAIDPGARRATFNTPKGKVELGYDFIHVVPPMRAPASVRNSPLPWQQGPLAADGWIEVSRSSLRHVRFPNVFAVGDVAGVPKGKTAASVKWQVPVAVETLVSELNGTTTTAAYNGYTSCPLITRMGRAMLIEFDYDGNLLPSFPFIDPLEEQWISWVIDEKALRGAYRAMLRGYA